MNKVFFDLLDKCVLIYLDDILIFSKNVEQHKKDLQQVFNSCCLFKHCASTAVELENLNLSWELIMENIDKDLKAAVNTEVSHFLVMDLNHAQSSQSRSSC